MYSDTYQRYRKLISAGKFGQAAHLAEEAHFAGNPHNPFWLTRQAAALNRGGKHKAARNAAGQALAVDSANPYALLAMADALKGLGQYEDAITHYREVAASAKLATMGQNGWLEALAVLSRWERVLELIAQWDLPPTRRLRWQAIALAALNQPDEALKTVKKWLQAHPDLPEALWLLTDLELKRDGLEAVLKRYGRLAKISSRPPIYKEIYASLCRRAGQPDLALKTYAKLDQGAANPGIQRKQAFALAKSGREKEAIPMLEELLKKNPTDFYLNSSYGGACRRTGQIEHAMAFYENQLKRHPMQKALYGWIKRLNKKQN